MDGCEDRTSAPRAYEAPVKALLDLNVLLDVVQNRIPHYQDSAEVVSRGCAGDFQVLIPAHAVTTLHYVLSKAAGRRVAEQTVDWLLLQFEVGSADRSVFRRAREIGLADFEDSVVASIAEANQCAYIVTRNLDDFCGSPVPSVLPVFFSNR